MFKRLIKIANKPKLPPTRKSLLVVLAYQAALLFTILVVVTFWPERAPALGPFTLLSMGLTMMLWLEAYENRLGGVNTGLISKSQIKK